MSKVDGYLKQAQALLPHGPAWTRSRFATLTKLLTAIAKYFARIHNRADELLREVYPQNTTKLILEWELLCGLPDSCKPLGLKTDDERRADIITKLTGSSSATWDYLTYIAGLYGYEIVFEECRPFIAGRSQCGKDRLMGSARIRSHVYVIIYGDKNPALECLLNRLKQAHISFTYKYIKKEI